MRALGVAERTIERMVAEAVNPNKKPFGKLKAEYGTTQTDIAEARLAIQASRGLVLMACDAMDRLGPKGAQREIGMVKIFVPRAVQHILDRAMQLHGGFE
jgi:acyl-CoA dehydrogenase